MLEAFLGKAYACSKIVIKNTKPSVSEPEIYQ